MAISNKFIWATDPKIDPVSGQPNKNASIDARLEQYGWDFKEKPLRQDLNLALNKIGANIEDLDTETTDFNINYRNRSQLGFRPQGVVRRDPSNVNRIIMDTISATFSLCIYPFNISEDRRRIYYDFRSGLTTLDTSVAWAATPTAGVYGIVPPLPGPPLSAGTYVVTAAYRESDGAINFFLVDDLTASNVIPPYVKSEGFSFSCPLFPIVYDGTNIIPFYVTGKRVVYYSTTPVTLLNSITTAANTLYDLDFILAANQRLIPNPGYQLGSGITTPTQTVRANVTLLITGADKEDGILGATGFVGGGSTPPYAELSESTRIGNAIAPDTFVYMRQDFESVYSKMYYYSTQAGNTVTISGVVRSYENPFGNSMFNNWISL